MDTEKFFDSEILRTIMTSLHAAGINQKAYRCWFKLNERTEISVATPAWNTETAEVLQKYLYKKEVVKYVQYYNMKFA